MTFGEIKRLAEDGHNEGMEDLREQASDIVQDKMRISTKDPLYYELVDQQVEILKTARA